jgi:DNA topoisomerase-1
VPCPQCGQGDILKRKSRRGKIFFSCARYPECDYAIWNQPLAQPCPECHWPITTIKTTKRSGSQRVCPQNDCNFTEPYEETETTPEAATG